MIEYPTISIITPNFNQAKYIEQTIQSVLSQNYPNLEYIIIDGGSNDGSIDIIKKYEHQLAYWVSEKDNGMYDAIQKGFAISTGEIMSYINSDDLLQPYSLFTAAEIFSKNQNIHWINGIPNIIDMYGRIVHVGSLPNWTKFHYLTGQYKFIQQEGVFWSRNLWDRSGARFNVNLKLAGDMELWSRFFFHEKLYYVPILIASFRSRKSGQKSVEQINEYYLEAESVIKSLKPSSEIEERIIKKYNSVIFKGLRKINLKFLFYFFGYSDVHHIFIDKSSTQNFNLETHEFKFI